MDPTFSVLEAKKVKETKDHFQSMSVIGGKMSPIYLHISYPFIKQHIKQLAISPHFPGLLLIRLKDKLACCL